MSLHRLHRFQNSKEHDAIILLHSLHGKAEVPLTTIGDIKHTVQSADETLTVLSLWYTATSDNVGRIARINRLEQTATLQPGEVIIIPKYLSMTSKALPSEAISKINSMK